MASKQYLHIFLRVIACWLVLLELANAQVLPVGTPVLEDYYRREQLQGRVDSTVSFVIRPLNGALLGTGDVYFPGRANTVPSDLQLQPLPVTLENQLNTQYPYGWNDGSMIPNKGYQFRLSAGLAVRYKFISVQLRPELVYANNGRYENHAKQPGFGLEWYKAIGNRIDWPEYFGTASSYSRFFPGQSHIRFTFDPVSFGVSTENLWWGPGRRNSLLMSNTAPGFLHATIQTSRPVSTPIGAFEGQLAIGRLNASGFDPSITGESLHQEMYYVEKPDSWRLFSGLVVNYQPKWLPGLSLGLIRSFTTYRTDMTNNPRDFLPFLPPVNKEATYLDDNGNSQVSSDVRDRYGSVFFRWVMPAGGFEVYGEYGRRERPENGRDWVVRPERSRAYVLGFSKFVSLDRPSGAGLQFNAEATELSVPSMRSDLVTPSWYTHHVVRDGYTHLGQLLGAGIGPGSNIQSVDVSWVRGLQQIGLEFERFAHNEDFFYRYVADIRRSWVDLGVGAFVNWDVGPVLLYGTIKRIHAYNYQHVWTPPTKSFWEFEPYDRDTWHIRFGASYRF